MIGVPPYRLATRLALALVVAFSPGIAYAASPDECADFRVALAAERKISASRDLSAVVTARRETVYAAIGAAIVRGDEAAVLTLDGLMAMRAAVVKTSGNFADWMEDADGETISLLVGVSDEIDAIYWATNRLIVAVARAVCDVGGEP